MTDRIYGRETRPQQKRALRLCVHLKTNSPIEQKSVVAVSKYSMKNVCSMSDEKKKNNQKSNGVIKMENTYFW